MNHALEIYQDHLDRVSHLIWTHQFEAVADLMVFPHELVIDDTVVQVDTAETLVRWASDFRARLTDLGATGYHRVAIAAAFSGDSDDRIDGFHRVYVLDGATHLVVPYSSEARLQNQNGFWLGSGVRATLRKARYVIDEGSLT